MGQGQVSEQRGVASKREVFVLVITASNYKVTLLVMLLLTT